MLTPLRHFCYVAHMVFADSVKCPSVHTQFLERFEGAKNIKFAIGIFCIKYCKWNIFRIIALYEFLSSHLKCTSLHTDLAQYRIELSDLFVFTLFYVPVTLYHDKMWLFLLIKFPKLKKKIHSKLYLDQN